LVELSIDGLEATYLRKDIMLANQMRFVDQVASAIGDVEQYTGYYFSSMIGNSML
jgi:hypothetical protein